MPAGDRCEVDRRPERIVASAPAGRTETQARIAANEREQLSAVLARLYDCAIDPIAWPAALEAIADYVGSDAVAIDFQDLRVDASVAGFSHGYAPGSHDLLIERYARAWALQSGMADWPVGAPQHLPDIVPREEFEAGLFFREWVRPQGHGDYIGLLAHCDAARFVVMSNARLARRGSYPGESLERMATLGPHVARTVAISEAFELRSVEQGLLEGTLDALSTPVFVLGAKRCVLHRNGATERLLEEAGGEPSVRHGRLQLPAEAATRVDALLDPPRDAVHDGHADRIATFPLPTGNGDDWLAMALSIDANRRAALRTDGGRLGEYVPETRGPAVVLFVREPFRRLPIGGEAARRLLGLTPAETRVASALASGLAPAGIADALGLSVETVRVHLRSVYAKAGVSRQADLVTLLREIGRPPG